MTTAASLISRTRHDYLSPGLKERRNKLTSSISDSDTTLTFDRPLNGLSDGSKLSIALEDIHVWSSDTAVRTADVDRGEYGTTAAAASAGATVLVDALYSDAQILRALNEAVSGLVSEGIFAVSTVELSYSTAVAGYDLASSSNVLGIIEAQWESTNSVEKLWSNVPVRLLRDANVADFASGTAVMIDHVISHGATVRVTYKHELTAGLAALSDVVETTTGLEADAMGLLSLGAALHLTAGKEIALNETDTVRHRRASETPPGSFSQADSNLRRLYRDRVRAERGRLSRKYPMRIREF